MGTRGNCIQLYITMGTVFSAFCDGGPLRWRTGTKNPRIWTWTNWEKVRGFRRELGIRNNTIHFTSQKIKVTQSRRQFRVISNIRHGRYNHYWTSSSTLLHNIHFTSLYKSFINTAHKDASSRQAAAWRGLKSSAFGCRMDFNRLRKSGGIANPEIHSCCTCRLLGWHCKSSNAEMILDKTLAAHCTGQWMAPTAMPVTSTVPSDLVTIIPEFLVLLPFVSGATS